MKELHFYKKSVYGIDRIYPMIAIEPMIRELTGKKTVDVHHLKALVALGHIVLIDNGQFNAEYI